MGDVVEKAGNLLGDGVNIAARLEAMAQQMVYVFQSQFMI